MQFSLFSGSPLQKPCDLLVFLVREKESLSASLSALAKQEYFTGKEGSSALMAPGGKAKAGHILFLGLGNHATSSLEAIREAAALSVLKARSCHASRLVFVLRDDLGLEISALAQAATEGLSMSAYEFRKFKSGPPDATFSLPKSCTFALPSKLHVQAKQGLLRGTLFAQGTLFARELVNEPAQHMHPQALVDAAKQIAGKSRGRITCRVFGRESLKRMGAGGILGVAQGSLHEPFLVHLTYRPSTKPQEKLAWIGKAVTFDSGGLSLKPADAMMTMKLDMAGAAAVLGAFSVLSELKPRSEIHGIFAACENMPSGSALRPGDVLTAMSGKTMEVLNTDAEGRLTLADALSYAIKLKPDVMVDLATLTGACVVALGEEIAGVMSNRKEVAARVLEAGEKAGEAFWELPLPKSYRKLIDSHVADIKNIGNKWGGVLTAGLFLQEFVGETPWAHLDIAGPAYAERALTSYARLGATGFGVRTLLEMSEK